MYADDNLDHVDNIKRRQISKSLFTLIFPQILKQLTKNAEDPENQDKLLDSVSKSYGDTKSKKSSLEINFSLTYAHFSNGVFFLGHPVYFTYE